MPPKSVKGSTELANSIKCRRNELDLTIEEAAAKAGIGTKTWSRYESGESIRKDKCRGICKALQWQKIPDNEDKATERVLDVKEYSKHAAWSPYLMEHFGKLAAVSFADGSDLLLDYLREDMESISSMPRGSHLGQVNSSFICSSLPAQFLTRYDYEFLYALRATVKDLRQRAGWGMEIIAHSVMEELALYLIVEEFRVLMDDTELDEQVESKEHEDEDEQKEFSDSWHEWIFGIFDDDDVLVYLYSGKYLSPKYNYHFDHWLENQFYSNKA